MFLHNVHGLWQLFRAEKLKIYYSLYHRTHLSPMQRQHTELQRNHLRRNHRQRPLPAAPLRAALLPAANLPALHQPFVESKRVSLGKPHPLGTIVYLTEDVDSTEQQEGQRYD